MVISLDANQSFTERDLDVLRGLDALGIAWIEEPLDPRRTPANGPHDLFARLAQLQRRIQTPVCLDESIFSAGNLAKALKHQELKLLRAQDREIRRYPACAAIRAHGERARHERVDGRHVRHRHLAGACMRRSRCCPAWSTPGDIGATSRYFDVDVTDPPYTVERGMVTLERRGHEHGLGCTLDRSALSRALIDQQTYE